MEEMIIAEHPNTEILIALMDAGQKTHQEFLDDLKEIKRHVCRTTDY